MIVFIIDHYHFLTVWASSMISAFNLAKNILSLRPPLVDEAFWYEENQQIFTSEHPQNHCTTGLSSYATSVDNCLGEKLCNNNTCTTNLIIINSTKAWANCLTAEISAKVKLNS